MSLPWHRNVRVYVLISSIVLAAVVFLWTWYATDDSSLRIIYLTQYYGLLAFAYLYLALLIGPAVYSFHWLPARGHIYRARRAVGFSAWILAMLHANVAFWGELGGLSGWLALPPVYLIATTLSFTALVILTLMAATSFDKMVQRLGMKRWKLLHRFIYLASFLVLIHAIMIGPHFADMGSPVFRISFAGLVLLVWLEARRFAVFMRSVWHRPNMRKP